MSGGIAGEPRRGQAAWDARHARDRAAVHAVAWAAHAAGEAPHKKVLAARAGMSSDTFRSHERALKAAKLWPPFPEPTKAELARVSEARRTAGGVKPGGPQAPPTPAEIAERAALIRREWAVRGMVDGGRVGPAEAPGRPEPVRRERGVTMKLRRVAAARY